MGARGRARDCAGTPRSTSGKNDDTSSDSGTSVRHHQVLDGSNALSNETAAESGNRDGAQCARLQHQARDGDHRRGRAAGGLGRLSRGVARPNKCQQTPWGSVWVVREPILLRSVLHDREIEVALTMARIEPLSTQPGPRADRLLTKMAQPPNK